MSLPCLSCGHGKLASVRPYRRHTPHGRAMFNGARLHECLQCGLVQVVPRPTPEALANYYAMDYRRGGYAGSDVADVNQFPKDNLFYFNRGQSIAELVMPYLSKGQLQILDAGAGYGHILHAFGQRYPRSARLAIEFSDVCVQYLKALGVHIFTQPVEEVLPQMEGQFDLVVLSHVLEHVLDPLAVLRLIDASLAPGGVVYVEVPNIPADSLLEYPDHAWAPRFDEPHIIFFSMATLRNVLESAGFELQFCDTAGPEYTYISPLRFCLPPLRSSIQSLLPSSLFLFLRRQRFTQPLRLQEREQSFHQYGGCRIWIRSVSGKKGEARESGSPGP